MFQRISVSKEHIIATRWEEASRILTLTLKGGDG